MKNIIMMVCLLMIFTSCNYAYEPSFLDVNSDSEIPSDETNSECILSNEDMYTCSTGENVIFFLLDRLDESYIREIIDDNDEWKKNELADFTYYDNFTGSYTRTTPSITYLLTGLEYDYNVTIDEYFETAWRDSAFLRDIQNAGYKSRLYTETEYVFGDVKYANGLFENIIHFDNSNQVDDSLIHNTHDGNFWKGFRDNGGITLEKNKGQFLFYHMGGAHDPYTLDKDGNIKEPSSQYEQLTGNMKMIFKYIEQLKDKGLYDSTTIIISADHGVTGSIMKLDHQRVLGLMIKHAYADNAEMKVSGKQICQDNLRASLISYFNDIPDEVTEKYGDTIEDVGENEERVRYFWMQAGKPGKRDQFTVTYKIIGDAKNFGNWSEISRVPIVYPFYDYSPESKR